MKPRLKTNKDGSRCLICYYSGDGYDRAIEQAEKDLNVVGEPITVICLPANGLMKRRMKYKRKVQ